MCRSVRWMKLLPSPLDKQKQKRTSSNRRGSFYVSRQFFGDSSLEGGRDKELDSPLNGQFRE